MKQRTLLMLLVFVLSIFAACENEEPSENKQSAIHPLKVVSYNVGACKNDLLEQDLLEQEYGEGARALIVITPSSTPGEITIKHINAWLACGATVVVRATLDTDKNIITLTESEEGEVAECVCMVDVTAEITGIEKGDYTLFLARDSEYLDISVKDEPTIYWVSCEK